MASPWKPRVDWALQQIEAHSRITQGVPEDELAAFQRHQGLQLPDAYLHFLRAAGMNPGEFLQGSDLRFEQLERLQSGAEALLDDGAGPTLPGRCFVFCGHQGYQFLFFRLDDGPDPQIHYYLQGEGKFKTVTPTFSDWLVQSVHEEFPDIPAAPCEG